MSNVANNQWRDNRWMQGGLITNVLDVLGSESETLSEANVNVKGVADVPVSGVFYVLLINIVVFVILIAFYEIFSRLMPSVYAGRSHHVTPDRILDLRRNVLPLSWVLPVLRVSWSQVRKQGGLDAYMFLRYLRMCLQITTVTGFWAALILIPVYATGGGDAEGWYHLSMNNITPGNWRLWIPTIFMWHLTFFVLYLMNEEYKHYSNVRMEFLAKGDVDVHPQQKYTLLVENIPHELRSDKALSDFFNSLFPDKVQSACVVMSVPDLDAACRRRARVVRRLEKSIALHEATGSRPTHVVGRKRLMCCGIESYPLNPFGGRDAGDYDSQHVPQRGERVDSVNYYAAELHEMNEKVMTLQRDRKGLAQRGDEAISASQWFHNMFTSSVRTSSPRESRILTGFPETPNGSTSSAIKVLFSFVFGAIPLINRHFDVFVENVVGTSISSTGFITFKDLVTVTCAINTPLCNKHDVLAVQQAPDPRDIQWSNAHVNVGIIAGRALTVNMILLLGVLLWSIPVAAIQAYCNFEYLAQIPGFEFFQYLPTDSSTTNLINSYLPVLALLGLMCLLPIIFQKIAMNYEDRKTYSDVEDSILRRYFMYQLANIYITVTASSLWISLQEVIDHPSNALILLGHSLPTVVGYFTSLLITSTLTRMPFLMLRFGSLTRMLFLKRCFNETRLTQRELDEIYKPEMLKYGYEYPMQLLVIVICFTYACISPIILLFGAFYFLVALVLFKKQVLIVYMRLYESGGIFFPSVCNRTLIGLVCGQLTLMGYTLTRAGYYQTLGMLPLPFFTFHMTTFFDDVYANRSKQLTVDIARELDKEVTASSHTSYDTSVDVYRQPVLAEPKAEPMPYRISPRSSESRFREAEGVSEEVGSGKVV